jgi:hypothetical protein
MGPRAGLNTVKEKLSASTGNRIPAVHPAADLHAYSLIPAKHACNTIICNRPKNS